MLRRDLQSGRPLDYKSNGSLQKRISTLCRLAIDILAFLWYTDLVCTVCVISLMTGPLPLREALVFVDYTVLLTVTHRPLESTRPRRVLSALRQNSPLACCRIV